MDEDWVCGLTARGAPCEGARVRALSEALQGVGGVGRVCHREAKGDGQPDGIYGSPRRECGRCVWRVGWETLSRRRREKYEKSMTLYTTPTRKV